VRASIIVASFLLTLTSTPASSQKQALIYFDGNKLLGDCQSEMETFRVACSQYIVAVSDTYTVTTNATNMTPVYCLRKSVTIGQLTDVVKAYLIKNPADRDISAPYLVIRALAEAFPCAEQ